MRKAAGAMLIIVGVYMLVGEITMLYRMGSHLFALSVFPIILAALTITGGVFCVRRRYWIVCLVTALIPVYFVITLLLSKGVVLCRFAAWELILPIVGILPIIFIGFKRKEWKEILG
jgi:hypothetical protein